MGDLILRSEKWLWSVLDDVADNECRLWHLTGINRKQNKTNSIINGYNLFKHCHFPALFSGF